jgi:hypothetical protein
VLVIGDAGILAFAAATFADHKDFGYVQDTGAVAAYCRCTTRCIASPGKGLLGGLWRLTMFPVTLVLTPGTSLAYTKSP